MTAFKFRDHDGHPLELLAFAEGRVPGEWRNADAGPFLGIDHTAIAVSNTVGSTRFFKSVFGFGVGTRTENRGPEQADLDDVDDVHVGVTRLAPDLAAPRLELLHYHVGTRRPIPHDTAGNDIASHVRHGEVVGQAPAGRARGRCARRPTGRAHPSRCAGGEPTHAKLHPSGNGYPATAKLSLTQTSGSGFR